MDDHPSFRATARVLLEAEGFDVVGEAADGASALTEAGRLQPEVVLLDVQLPDIDGVEVCRRLRARGTPTRIIMATARDGVAERVAGLDTGADDYLVKPYSTRELIARLRALLRRPEEGLPRIHRLGTLELDTGSRRARRGEREIELTTKEFAVLEYMMRNAGRVLTREQISEHAWDANYDPFSNVIDVYIARLRRKVDTPGEAALIETVRGAGYRIGDPRTRKSM